MKLVRIPEKKFEEYRINAIFDCYKWDPQFLDNNTLSKYVLVLNEKEYHEIAELTENLDSETQASEIFLNSHLHLTKILKLSPQIYKELKSMSNYDKNKHIRLMRYDFHPTIENNWVISEVNSDVPGGFAEASLLPELAIKTLGNKKYYSINFGNQLAQTISQKIKNKGTIMFVHCTSYSDDRQVMQYLGDKMASLGYKSLYGAADHLKFINKEAFSILDNHQEKVDFIFRFTPIEWLIDIKPKTWSGYFNTITPSCNHPIAIFAQTKRFPLIWPLLEKNNIKLLTWKKLLPNTLEVKQAKGEEYIYKPAYGRVGENISIKDACTIEEYQSIIKDVHKHPQKYIAQKKFNSKPLCTPEGTKYHVCLGSYTIDGHHAGFYARISTKPRIDSDAEDIPVVIERSNNHEQ